MAENERTPPPLMAGELSMAAHQPQESAVSVTRLQVPFPMLAGFLTFAIGTVFAIALAWFKVTSHSSSADVHLDPVASLKGGGPAYQMDLVSAEKKTRKMLKSMEINCRQAADGMNCRVFLPEE